MKKEITTQTNRFLSIQTKQALLYALQEAEKTKTEVLTLKFLFYGLLKTNSSILKKIIANIYKKNGKLGEDNKTLLYRCERSFSKDKNYNSSDDSKFTITLSKPLRNVLYSCLRDTKTAKDLNLNSKKYIVITTISLFNSILKNQALKDWLINEIFIINRKK
jgi:ATP-dependent Clp protease ATP-binding subunit ClpA